MKYSGLLKITMPSALTYCAAGALTLLVLEVLWPVVTGSHAQASFDWVTMIGIIGWVSGLYMSQGVIGIGFQTGASRKTMVLAHWTFWLIVSAGYSAVAMIGQTLLVNFGINSTTRMSGFPNYMVAGHGISTFIFFIADRIDDLRDRESVQRCDDFCPEENADLNHCGGNNGTFVDCGNRRNYWNLESQTIMAGINAPSMGVVD